MLYMVSTPSLHTQESIKASLQCTINNIIIHIYIYIIIIKYMYVTCIIGEACSHVAAILSCLIRATELQKKFRLDTCTSKLCI